MMNIREELLKQQIRVRKDALLILQFAVSSDQNFKELMDCFLEKDIRLVQRACRIILWCVEEKPDLLQPYFSTLVGKLKEPGNQHAIIRNSLRIFEDMEIPEKFHGEIMDACFIFLHKNDTPIAIKAFALTRLFKFSQAYPEIKTELRFIIEEHIAYETAAYKSRGKKILARL